MVKQTIVVQNETGLHARPAARFVQLASKFKSEISVLKVEEGERINAKSIMGIMSGGISQGTLISIEAEGEDEDEAVASLIRLVESNLDEA
ncbi:MAG: HPr family phosphocarrier protein [Lutisporaceae bacterium]